MNEWRQSGPVLVILALVTILVFMAAAGYSPKGTAVQEENGGNNGESGILSEEDKGFDREALYSQKMTPTQPTLPISDSERRLLVELYDFMENEDLVSAAALLNGNLEQFKVLTDKSLEGKVCFYYVERTAQGEEIFRMRDMTAEVSGYGMALTRFNTVFFGNFENGAPEGECTAIQTVILEDPRYTFADGIWKNGKMNGEGITGYRYYDGKPEGSFESIVKSGTYADNLLDGELVYEADNGSGRVLHWNIKADRGVTVLDESWTYYNYSDEYMLRSQEDEDRAYVISGETVDQIRWNNLILWENGENGS